MSELHISDDLWLLGSMARAWTEVLELPSFCWDWYGKIYFLVSWTFGTMEGLHFAVAVRESHSSPYREVRRGHVSWDVVSGPGIRSV